MPNQANPTHERFWQILLIVGTVGFSWFGLQAVHELGHVLHAWYSGGTVVEVVLHPTSLSHTLVVPNPCPRFVAWGGPIWGCLLPLALWGVVRVSARRYEPLARFFAGACLVANGVYLGASVFAGGNQLDGPAILAAGGSIWSILLFSLVTVVLGFFLWNGLGPHYGLSKNRQPIDRHAALIAAIACMLMVAAEMGFSI